MTSAWVCCHMSIQYANLLFIILETFQGSGNFWLPNVHASVSYGSPKYILQKLQLVQNAAARLVKLSRKHEHITPHLIDLHWLPIEYRIQFKVLLLTYKALNGLAPSYLSDLLKRYAPVRKLRSSSAFLLQPKKFRLATYGSRAFSVSAPELWNRLPLNIKLCPSIDKFKAAVKTHLFKSSFL